MKKLLLLILLLPSVAFANCAQTTSGVVYIKGHRLNFYRFGRSYIETSCTARRPGWIYWRGGLVCTGRYIFFRNANGRSGYCKVRKVRM